MRLVTWNIAGRRGCLSRQVGALRSINGDLVALQEVTRSTSAELAAALVEAGWRHQAQSFDQADESDLRGPRKYGLLIAAKVPLSRKVPRFAVPWPERFLTVALEFGGLTIELSTTHIPPGSSNGWVKVEMLEAVYSNLANMDVGPKILCGDFNTPQAELPNRTVITWAERYLPSGVARERARIRGRPVESWRLAERAVLLGLSDFGMHDVFRAVHGYERADFSIQLRRGPNVAQRRFDHVIASTSLDAERCTYEHRYRLGRLSDHAPLIVDFSLSSDGTVAGKAP